MAIQGYGSAPPRTPTYAGKTPAKGIVQREVSKHKAPTKAPAPKK